MRLDLFVSKMFNNISRQKAIELIKSNQILVNNNVINKPSFKIKTEDKIIIKDELFIESEIFCSRAAFKLQGFLQNNCLEKDTSLFLDNTYSKYDETIFSYVKKDAKISKKNIVLTNEYIKSIKQYIYSIIKDSIILDVGASAGGFTQVLLSFNPKLVVSQDVGSMQLKHILKQNKKVISFENIDIRDFARNFYYYRDKIHEYISSDKTINDVTLSNDYKELDTINIDFLVCDVSFISLRNIFFDLLSLSKCMLLLFKPQYEVGVNVERNKNGVIKSHIAVQKSLESFSDFLKAQNAKYIFIETSHVKGKEGNEEFFIFCQF